jgi:hypothetical protein
LPVLNAVPRAFAAQLLGNEELVWIVPRDLENPAQPEKEKALFRCVAKVNPGSPQITADMQPLYAVEWTDEAIYYAIKVCALFNFYNRWIDAAGVHAMSEEAHQTFGARTAQHGYIENKLYSFPQIVVFGL